MIKKNCDQIFYDTQEIIDEITREISPLIQQEREEKNYQNNSYYRLSKYVLQSQAENNENVLVKSEIINSNNVVYPAP